MSIQSSRQASPPRGPSPEARRSARRARWTLAALVFVCAAPIVGAYLTYYVIKPRGGATNYGALIEPQRPIPSSLAVTDEGGQPIAFASLKGKWLLVMEDASACGDACAKKLYFMRQVRATQGAERARITTVWLRSDSGPVPGVIENAYPDTRRLIADPAAVAAWLPADAGTRVTDHIYVVDPNGNLMMRFPKNPDPSKIKGDVTKLLKWSRIG